MSVTTVYRIIGTHPLVGEKVVALLPDDCGPKVAAVMLRQEVRERPDWTNMRVQAREVGAWTDVPE